MLRFICGYALNSSMKVQSSLLQYYLFGILKNYIKVGNDFELFNYFRIPFYIYYFVGMIYLFIYFFFKLLSEI